GTFKCRENWPNWEIEIAFNVILDILLLVLPLFIMMAAYLKITVCLWQGIQIERQATNYNQQSPTTTSETNNDSSETSFNYKSQTKVACNEDSDGSTKGPDTVYSYQQMRKRLVMRPLRSTNFDKSLAAKKRVIAMLFVVVLEFFICWAPLYIVNTMIVFKSYPNPSAMTYIHLLAYISSCCNPITYCFMNLKFRQAFLQAFGCGPRLMRRGTSSANGTSFYNRHSTNRTVIEDKELETQL
uniref:G-protein coupled receptors family 1 profile domain-containing protein n=1 Tax=Strigamia maritima TaxID=126957 RepID=T1J5H3_STRMM